MADLPRLSRRAVIKQLAGASAAVPLTGFAAQLLAQTPQSEPGGGSSPLAERPGGLSDEDDELLDEIERATFLYFWEQSSPETGIVRDRFNVRAPDKSDLGSIAATGFGFTALCIGQQRGWVSYDEARDRALAGLRFLWEQMPHHRGFFYHWANINNGDRLWDSEVSSIDSAILLCGVLTCRKHFADRQIEQLAHQVFNRVDWNWLSEDTRILPHGWRPETGFLQFRWENYSEMMMMYLLGLGSYSHPLPADAWNAWKRTIFEYHGIRYIGSFAPLFIHQYSQAWFDFRGKRDRYADYFQNSVLATDVHRRFCLDLAGKFPDYSDDLWGISASDSPKGYAVWGGPPATGPIDGTVVPSAAGGSIPFMPRETMRVLRTIKDRYGSQAWSRYGFVNAFNPRTKWYNDYVLGIDTGITLLMAENVRTGFVWNTFMKNPEARQGMKRAGFVAYKPDPTGTPTGIIGPRAAPAREGER
jgi:hypothetical protein